MQAWESRTWIEAAAQPLLFGLARALCTIEIVSFNELIELNKLYENGRQIIRRQQLCRHQLRLHSQCLKTPWSRMPFTYWRAYSRSCPTKTRVDASETGVGTSKALAERREATWRQFSQQRTDWLVESALFPSTIHGRESHQTTRRVRWGWCHKEASQWREPLRSWTCGRRRGGSDSQLAGTSAHLWRNALGAVPLMCACPHSI